MNTIETLNLLLRTCRDGQAGFRLCAEEIRSDELRPVLNARADECARAAEELKGLLARHGGRADDTTSMPADLHRGWMIARAAISGRDELAILAECERGEDVAVRDYRLALEQELPEDVRQVIEHQFEGVRRNHDQVKALRDERIRPGDRDESGTAPGRQTASAGAGRRLVQRSLAEIRVHPLRSLGIFALIGVVGWRASARRSGAIAGWLRRRA